MQRFQLASLLLVLFLASYGMEMLRPAAAARAGQALSDMKVDKKKKDDSKHPFKSPVGWFIQERASKQLPGPGQHFSFGALKPWQDILSYVLSTPDTKLLLVVRHGQAVSNWLSDTLGPDEWFDVEQKCSYTNKDSNTTYGVFDAELTDLGKDQARSLNSILNGGGWFAKLTGNQTVRSIVSPLSRCLQTAALVTEGLGIKTVNVEENVRETLGEDTCDARRSVSDPDPDAPYPPGPCNFEQGLKTRFPQYKFPVVGSDTARASNGGFGLLSDADILWTKERETQKEQTKRATRFLYDVFTYAPERVVVVVSHSGFARSLLLAVDREPYRPQNTELIPIVLSKGAKRESRHHHH